MNTHIIETIYILGALVAILAAYPQLRQLVKTKQSDEFSVATWAIWLVTQCVSLVYVASLGNKLMVLVNMAWISFYFAMTILILYYHPVRKARRTRRSDMQTEYVPQEDAA